MIFVLIALSLSAEPSPLNEKVVEFTRSKVGQKVGDGECTALALEALRHAGARLPGQGQESWGEEVTSLNAVGPGDILQFEDAVFVGRRLRAGGALVKWTVT